MWRLCRRTLRNVGRQRIFFESVRKNFVVQTSSLKPLWNSQRQDIGTFRSTALDTTTPLLAGPQFSETSHVRIIDIGSKNSSPTRKGVTKPPPKSLGRHSAMLLRETLTSTMLFLRINAQSMDGSFGLMLLGES